MRFVKVLLFGITLVLTLLTVEIVLRLPNDAEIALFGPDRTRADLVQMRMARMILAVSPEQGSRALASLGGADPDLVEANLRIIARLDLEDAGAGPIASGAEDAEVTDAAVDPRGTESVMDVTADRAPLPDRDMGRGGARFIRVN